MAAMSFYHRREQRMLIDRNGKRPYQSLQIKITAKPQPNTKSHGKSCTVVCEHVMLER
jgi:hypothetical protein